MGGDVLSQSEVENLLNAMASGSEEAMAAVGVGDSAPKTGGAELAPAKPREKISPYDF